LGKRFRYNEIDSASYPVREEYYQTTLTNLFTFLEPELQGAAHFYEGPLAVALNLLVSNDRDEAARFEPMVRGENKAAFLQAGKTVWGGYPYTVIMVPGEGPEIRDVAISPNGKMRCKLAAEAYRKRQAPFIIVSGGYVHPFQTKFCEALEMKRYLMGELGIPEAVIIIEPHARHTTTNFRNAARLMLSYRIPVTRPALCVTTIDQTDYIMMEAFDKRNIRELGYVPYVSKKRLSDQAIAFYPVITSTTVDPKEPLDP
jgi:hypothetical protein